MKKRFLFLSALFAMQTFYAHSQEVIADTYSAADTTGLNKGTAQYKLFSGNAVTNRLRWSLAIIGNETGQTTDTAGANFRIFRHNNNGDWIQTALAIERSTGLVEMYSGFRANSATPGKAALTGAGITGTGTGIANTSVLGFYESNGTKRQGMIGKYVNNSNDMFLVSETGGIRLSPMGDGAVHISGNGVRNVMDFYQAEYGPPTPETRSIGTRLVLHTRIAAGSPAVDYAMGLQLGATVTGWFSVPSNTETHYWDFYGGTVPVVRLDGAGNISTKGNVNVVGDVSTRKLKVATTAWPDFVFADDYKLPSLQDVSRYIKENHRLPGVPAAAEVEKSGLDVGEMQKTMMEKIEQLTLHLIRLDEENRQLKEELEKLKASK